MLYRLVNAALCCTCNLLAVCLLLPHVFPGCASVHSNVYGSSKYIGRHRLGSSVRLQAYMLRPYSSFCCLSSLDSGLRRFSLTHIFGWSIALYAKHPLPERDRNHAPAHECQQGRKTPLSEPSCRAGRGAVCSRPKEWGGVCCQVLLAGGRLQDRGSPICCLLPIPTQPPLTFTSVLAYW